MHATRGKKRKRETKRNKEGTREREMECLLLVDACRFEALSDGGDTLRLLGMVRIVWIFVLTHAIIVDQTNPANSHSC